LTSISLPASVKFLRKKCFAELTSLRSGECRL
jgi:hypothetical protein